MLDPFSDIFGTPFFPYHYHTTAIELKNHFKEKGWDWDKYFVFTTVRNPWDMMVSYFTFFKPDVNFIYNYESEREGLKYQKDNLCNFNDWILNGKLEHHLVLDDGQLKKDVWLNGFSRLNLEKTACDFDGNVIVNKILKVEEIDKTLIDLFKFLGIYKNFYPMKINDSKHENYRSYYNTHTMKKIEKEFAFDIEFGKYKF
jgi:hypothetical protein